EPYKAAALGPFSMVTLATSSGLMLDMALPKSTRLSAPTCDTLLSVLAIGTPSTTNKGWLSLLNELAPRITILTEDPAPPVWLMVTPDTSPDKEFKTFSCATRLMSLPATSPT